MRIFETLLVSIVAACLIFLLSPAPYRTNKLILYALGAMGALFLILHFWIEHFRWQMVPLYGLFALVLAMGFFSAENRSLWGWIGLAFVVFITLISILPPILFPVKPLPSPTGPYPIGTFSEQWKDDSRKEIFGNDPNASREFVTQTWYPAASGLEGQTADYLPSGRVAARTIAGRLGLPFFLLDHLDLITTNSIEKAPPADGAFPILIFSHGYNSFRGQSTTLMEDLASHGYIVISMSHPYGSAITIFPDSRIIFHNEKTLEGVGNELRRTGLILGAQWEGDIRYIFDQLEAAQHNPTHPLSTNLDLERMGVFGHSTGGGVAATICSQEPRCRVAMGLDAWLGPTPDEILQAGSPVPIYYLMSEFWPKTENTNRIRQHVSNSADAHWATVANTGHYDFADIPFLSPLTKQIGFSGGIDPYRGQEINRAFVRSFFDQHLKGGQSDFLYQPSPSFPEIAFGIPADVSQNDE